MIYKKSDNRAGGMAKVVDHVPSQEWGPWVQTPVLAKKKKKKYNNIYAKTKVQFSQS
jgi:hypothetical protein